MVYCFFFVVYNFHIYIYILFLYLNRLSWKRVVSIAMLDYWMIGNTLTPPFLVSKCCFQASHAAWEATNDLATICQSSMTCKMVNKNMGPKTFLQVPCTMYFQVEDVKVDKVEESRRAILFSQV